MKKNNFLFAYIFLFVIFAHKAQSQSASFSEDTFTEQTSSQDKFGMYLDSIKKYLYRNVRITESAFEECRKIIEQETPLADSLLFQHHLFKVNYLLNKQKPLDAFQLILDSEPFTKNDKTPKKLKSSFNYYKAYTYMVLGDLEAAQKTYYTNLESAEVEKDTNSMMSSLYSLGQLYSDEDDYDSAIKCFSKILEYDATFESKPMTIALTNLELGETYYNKKEYRKALEIVNNIFPYLEEQDLNLLLSDFLFYKGVNHLKLNEIDSARYVSEQFSKLDESIKDEYAKSIHLKFLGKLYTAQKMYGKALDIYKNRLEQVDSIDFVEKRAAYSNAHEICKEMGNFEGAYNYLLAYNDAKKQMDEDEKKQKTAYLKIKFDSEQKEKDNAILSAQIAKKQTQQKLLYAFMAILGLCLLGLFGAFYQKIRYNRKLETEVVKRTQSLKESNDKLVVLNKELDEFNRILSHDLREPLRDIIGFSQMGMKEVGDKPRAKEYLEFVVRGGKQLGQLINDVNNFQRQSKIVVEENIPIDFEAFIEKITYVIKQKYPDKDIQLVDSNLNEIAKIVTDPQIITPVFQNIIDNAVKFNAHETVHIKINYYPKDEVHCFEIEDNGIGIKPEYYGKVFNMFARLNNKLNYSGSGLGLSLAKKLIEKVGGSISVLRSQVNQGSTFVVQFAKTGITR